MKQLESEQLKQFISGLSKNFLIEINGTPCVEVNIHIDENDNTIVNFISGVYDTGKDITSMVVGCETCKHYEEENNYIVCEECCSTNPADCSRWEIK